MRARIALCLLATAALAAPAAAQDAESLRRDLTEMRRQFEAMRDGYEKKINDLAERLQKLEAAPVAPPAPAAAQAAPEPPPPAQLSIMDLVRPRQPFSLYRRRGAGQLKVDVFGTVPEPGGGNGSGSASAALAGQGGSGPNGETVVVGTKTLDRYGWYLWGEVQPLQAGPRPPL